MHVDFRHSNEVELGATRRLKMKLAITEDDSGFEDRNRTWSQFKREYDIAFPISARDHERLTEVTDAFLATGGGEDSFDFEDWRDHTATDEAFGTGDATETEFALIKTHSFGSRSHERRIYRPVSPIAIEIDGVAVPDTDYTVDYDLGIVTFDTAPDVGEVLTWSGEFYVPVRFDGEQLSTAVTTDQEHLDTITLYEVRLKAEDFDEIS